MKSTRKILMISKNFSPPEIILRVNTQAYQAADQAIRGTVSINCTILKNKLRVRPCETDEAENWVDLVHVMFSAQACRESRWSVFNRFDKSSLL